MKKILYLLLLTPFCIDAIAQSKVPKPPRFNLNSYILIDANTNTVLAEFDADIQINPASMTKVMNGYVIADQIAKGAISLDDEVKISKKAWLVEGSDMFIEVDDIISARDLISGIVIVSGNDAAIAMAEHVAYTTEDFVDWMNSYALDLGLDNTSFQNVSGFTDPNHYSSARDLANLTKALIKNFPEHYALYKEKEFTWDNRKQLNRNGLLWRDPTIDGVKTGHTQAAGYCLISSAKRNDMRLIAVVAGSPSAIQRLDDSQRLLEYGFRFFATQKLITKDTEITAAEVWGGKIDKVALGTKQDIFLTLPRSDFKNIKANYKFNNNIQAPISEGDVIGDIEFLSNDKVVFSAPLIAIEAVEAKGFFGRIWARTGFWILSLFPTSQND
jgi:serine-type D-Ala-D-Ala carboxypeptidase (penicillin-binding protein 5/6)